MIRRWWALAAALLTGAASARADGGRVRAYEAAGDFRVAIFTSPEPLTAGPADVSVLVQDRASGEAILDAEVTLSLSGPGGLSRVESAGRHARNRLFYGASVRLSPGAWSATARIRRRGAEAAARAEFDVAASPTRSFDPRPYLSIPPIAVALYAANRSLRNRERRRRRS